MTERSTQTCNHRRAAPAVLVLAALVAACRPPVGSVPTHRDESSGAAGIQTGTLVSDRGCVYLREPSIGHRWLVVWPEGYELRGSSIMDGDVVVADLGEAVSLGGGELHESEFGFLDGKLLTDVPAPCRDGDYWVASRPED